MSKDMAELQSIDLNADVGESFGIYKIGCDEDLIPLISSANIACGYHAGDATVMRRTLVLTEKYGVAAGAHPGFPDLLGFGRRELAASLEEIQDYLVYQVGALQAFARQAGLKLQHVKLHGALYNMAARDKNWLEGILTTLAALDPDLIFITLAGAGQEQTEALAQRYGIPIAFEFFADRAYQADGTLVSRRETGAVLQDQEEIAQRTVRMIREGRVAAKDGGLINLKADTVCLHGDHPRAADLARHIRQALAAAGIAVKPLRSIHAL